MNINYFCGGNIINNTFQDADAFQNAFGTMDLITEEDEAAYASNKAGVERLTAYVKSEAGIEIMREAIERATIHDVLPEPYPASEVLNMGRVKAIVLSPEQIPSLPRPFVVETTSDELSERPGCLFWFKRLFKIDKKGDINSVASDAVNTVNHSFIPEETKDFLKDKLGKSVAALKRADEKTINLQR